MEIEATTLKIEKLKRLYDGGGKQSAGPNFTKSLFEHYFFLYWHINRNYIVYDTFNRYKILTEKVFKGLVTSYQIPEWGLSSFSDFILTETILNINPKSLQEILNQEEILKVLDDGIVSLLDKLNNLTNSLFVDGLFSEPIENTLVSGQLNNYLFRDKFRTIFSNLFTVLSKLDITKEQFKKSKTPLIKFLKVEQILSWSDLKEFSNFLFKKGSLFEAEELIEILKIAINNDKNGNNKYKNLIKTIPNVLVRFYPDYKIDNENLVQKAILNCISDSGRNTGYSHLINLVNASNKNCKQLLLEAFEKGFDENFNSHFYEELIRNSDFNYSSRDYFQLYSEAINEQKGGNTYKFGSLGLTDIVFFNYIFIIYKLNIDFERPELKVLNGLNHFESWLLNPMKFDYQHFEAIWLTDLNTPTILDRLKGNINIAISIEAQLRKKFNPVLAELKYKYFQIEE